MSQRNQFIILGALVVLLGIVGFLQFGRSRARARTESASPPPVSAAPATAAAPASAGAEAQPAAPPPDSGPSADDLRELAGWFDLLRPTGTVIARGSSPVFGIAVKPPPPAPVAPSKDAAPIAAQVPWMTEPGRLDGIIKSRSGPGKALFQGVLYQVGDKVRGTNFTLVAVEDDYVTLKSDDRVIRRFWHE